MRMIVIEKLEDLINARSDGQISITMINLAQIEFEGYISNLNDLGFKYDPKEHGIAILISKSENPRQLIMNDHDIITDYSPIYVCEYSYEKSTIVKACIHIEASYYINIYFYKYINRFLCEWCESRFKQKRMVPSRAEGIGPFLLS
jgi:hypothetical protein